MPQEGRETVVTKQRAAMSSVVWSLFLTAIKILAGLATNSVGMLSEALHSALDLLAAGLTFLAVRIADIPPDKNHPFGHGKVESLSALAETGLLLGTCVWITSEALQRLFIEPETVEPNVWAFAVIIISLAVDISRSAMLRRVAKEQHSQAIAADALHFSTDILSSAVVLLGLICVSLAAHVTDHPLLKTVLIQADAVAALVVAGAVLTVSWHMAKRAINSLMDCADVEATEKLRELLDSRLPQWRLTRIRVRESGSRYFVDMVFAIPAAMSTGEAHAVCDTVEALVATVLPQAETVIHLEPLEATPGHSD